MEKNKNNNHIKLGKISYMNVAPVYYGLDNGHKPSWLEIVSAPPSDLNLMLEKKELDISPISSVAYTRHHNEWLIMPGLSISCMGPVMSVILVSECPFYELSGKKILLTRESATAALLLRYLLACENIRPHMEKGIVGAPWDLRKNTPAALIIGDMALKIRWKDYFPYVYDLGEIWWKKTSLPFVFALWAVRKSFAMKNPHIVNDIIKKFEKSKAHGRKNMENIVSCASEFLGIPENMCGKYYSRLNYDLKNDQIKGLEHFFRGLYRENIISRPVKLSFFQDFPMPRVKERAA